MVVVLETHNLHLLASHELILTDNGLKGSLQVGHQNSRLFVRDFGICGNFSENENSSNHSLDSQAPRGPIVIVTKLHEM